MHVIALSINYKETSVEEREKVSFNDYDLSNALHRLREQKSILEAVLLSTCNRTEVYVVTDQLHTGKYYVQAFLADYFDVELDFIKKVIVLKTDSDAIEQLYRVTAGLESMVLGETQILGQMRDAFLKAQEEHTTGAIFNKLFKEAITVAKRGHSETDISSNAISISYAAIELVKKVFQPLSKKNVLVVGAGDMAEQSLLNLTAAGVTNVTVVNRSIENAAKLAGQFGYQCASLNELQELIRNADLVISSTSAQDYVITKEMIEANHQSKRSPLVLMDIALPRDIDPKTSELENVFMYNVDDLQHIVDSNLATRQKEARKIELMIAESMDEYENWVKMLGVVPVIQAMRTKALRIHDETLESVFRKMPDMTKREQTIVSKHMKSIINQMLKDPIIFAKEIANDRNRDQKLDDIKRLFNIEDEVQAIVEEEKMKRKEKLLHRKSLLSLQ